MAAEAEDGQHVSDAQDVDKAAALGESTGAAPAALESSAPVGSMAHLTHLPTCSGVLHPRHDLFRGRMPPTPPAPLS